MNGLVKLTTSFDLPQGDADVLDKLRLAGKVTIVQARFTSEPVQDKVDEVSRLGQGRPKDASVDAVASNITAAFALKSGTLTINNLAYRVPGVTVNMGGAYQLESGALDFSGTARLAASLSQTQTGYRQFLLKPFDGLFRKGGAGTRLAFKVTGSVDDPKVGLDLRRTLKGR
jgi:hypothetical protein